MNFAVLAIFSAAVCAVLTYLIISFSKYIKIGQSIRKEGPESHIIKSGTATMGGIAVLVSFFIASVVFLDLDKKMLALMLLTAGFGVIGLLDDLIKVLSGRNEALKPSQKMALQMIAALLFGSYLLFAGHESTVTGYLRQAGFYMGWLYLPLVAFMIISASNAANLTDGLDGLLPGTAVLAAGAYAAVALKLTDFDAVSVCTIMAGSLLGFVLFNFKPAKIFMGDCGSLAIGAFIAGIAVIIHKELLLLLIGGVFVVEALSVIVQVSYFKMTGKRVLRMSPLHHHFELSGMSEKSVVLMFWGAGLIFAVLGVMIM